MTGQQRSSGVVLHLPAHLAVEELPTEPPAGRDEPSRPRRGFDLDATIDLAAEGDATADLEADPIVQAMQDQDLSMVDRFVLSAAPSASPTRTADREAPRSTLDIVVEEHEDAVILLEQDGIYEWRYPTEYGKLAASKRVRGQALVEPRTRTIRFDLSEAPAAAKFESQAPAGNATRKRGLTEFVAGRVRTYVFKFAARVAVKAGIGFLERKTRTGLVLLDTNDPTQWTPFETLDQLDGRLGEGNVQLPTDRPVKILLLVHGTFSSTLGSYGALGYSDYGQTFLQQARTHYDAVIGYDHRTLSVDPLTNAEDMLGRLEGDIRRQLEIDAIAFSRGALVLRSLTELLLPHTNVPMRVRRAVFVGSTNGGTELARTENWTHLIDLTTNLVSVGTRLLSLYAPAAPVAQLIRESIDSLGALIKAIVTEGLKEKNVPGLAAMSPDGAFVKQINKRQRKRAIRSDTLYYAVTSDFDLAGAARAEGQGSLPARLAQWIADTAVDRLINEPNDLVVNVSSMTDIDPSESFIEDVCRFGNNPHVYHTVYFTREETARSLSRWLGMTAVESALGAEPALPAMGDDRFIVVNAEDSLAEVVGVIRDNHPTFVIAEREVGEPQPYRYAYRSEELLRVDRQLKSASPGLSLETALNTSPFEMHESGSSPQAPVKDWRNINVSGDAVRSRIILHRDGVPVSVVESGAAIPSVAELLQVDRQTQDDLDQFIRDLKRRRSPRDRRATSRGDLENLDVDLGRVTLFARADMPQTIPVHKRKQLIVTISNDQLIVQSEGISEVAQTTVDPNKTVLVDVIGKNNLEVLSESHVELPPTGPERTLVFDVRGLAAGEAEVWVLIRQGVEALGRLILRPTVTGDAHNAADRRIAETADMRSVAASGQRYPKLEIIEQYRPEGLRYKFLLDLGDDRFLQAESDVLQRSRQEFVDDIYRQIETAWLANHSDLEAFHEELRAFGGTLLDELIPLKIQRALWNVREELCSIMVLAEEPFIPWELVHLKEPPADPADVSALPDQSHFLAEKGLVRWLYDAPHAPQQLVVRTNHSHYVIPDYQPQILKLPMAQDEIPFLENTFGAQPLEANENVIRKLLRVPDAVDFFHFSGHGEAGSDKVLEARILMHGVAQSGKWNPRFLEVKTIAQHARLTGSAGVRPMIMLNACQVGRQDWRLSSIGGFADAFLRAGAGTFVGSLWSVGDAPAKTFSEAFYTALVENKTLAEAAVAGRQAAQQAQEATWLAYAVYGHPNAKVSLVKPDDLHQSQD